MTGPGTDALRPCLKPCPLCAGKAEFVKEGTWPPGYRVFCTGCKTMTRWATNPKTVTEVWNTRATPPQPKDQSNND